MPPPGFKVVSLPERMLERASPYARALDYTDAQFLEHCVNAICQLAEMPRGQRVVPKIVRIAAEAVAAEENREPMSESPADADALRDKVAGLRRKAVQKATKQNQAELPTGEKS